MHRHRVVAKRAPSGSQAVAQRLPSERQVPYSFSVLHFNSNGMIPAREMFTAFYAKDHEGMTLPPSIGRRSMAVAPVSSIALVCPSVPQVPRQPQPWLRRPAIHGRNCPIATTSYIRCHICGTETSPCRVHLNK
jgi:hypothetical protein